MKALYISTYNDDKYFQTIFDEALIKPLQSIQKFNKLLVTGLIENNDIEDVTVLTTACVNREISKKKFWKGKNHKEGKLNYWYIPFLNIKLVKQLCMAFFSIFFILFWCLKNIGKNKVLISDGFYPIVSSIASIVCKLFSVDVITFYTDVPACSAAEATEKKSFVRNIIKKVINIGDYVNLKCSDMFIFLTDAMNDLLNKNNKPYMVMEGLVDNDFELTNKVKKKEKAIMYAGGLYEKYGVKLLIDSFIEWNNGDYELWLCGHGDLDDYAKKLSKKKVRFFGTINNKEVLKLEEKAMLLVNPRLTNEEYTKYSFPSKNMEYMLSGTPLLTTKLPGMPEEYNEFVFTIDKETKKGFIEAIKSIFKKSKKELKEFGKSAQNFVKNEKNNKRQATRIVEFIKQNKKERKIENLLITFFLLINIFLLLLSMLNIYDLFKVSFKAYFLYILSVFLTIIGIRFIPTFKNNVNDKKEQNNIIINIFNSKWFDYFLTFTFVGVLAYLVKYLYLISSADASEIRMIAFTKLYSNAFSSLFYIYILTSFVRVIQLLIPIFLFDKELSNVIPKSKIAFMILIFLMYSLIGLARLNFLFIIIVTFFAIIYFSDIKKILSKNKIISFILILLSIFIISTLMLYIRLGSVSLFNTIIEQVEQIFVYFLGSFRALDNYLTNGFKGLNFAFGRATLGGFDEIIFWPIKIFNDNAYSFNQILGVHTQNGIAIGFNNPYYNAFYTAVMNFYLDFGFIGVIINSFLHGVFIKLIINLFEQRNSIILKVLLLLVSYNLVMTCLNWQYQSGNMIFLIVILIILEFSFEIIAKFKEWKK